MITLIIICIGLISLVGSICTVLYMKLQSISTMNGKLKQQVGHLEVCMHELVGLQSHINKSVNNLAKDVLQRDVYQATDDRHQLAIKAAKAGNSLSELVRKHGLSSDEAALIIALHAGNPSVETPKEQKSAMETMALSAELIEVD